MQVKNTFTILFWINKAKTNKGEAPVWARVTVDGKRAEMSIKRSISPELWNAEKGIAKGSNEVARAMNSYIDQVRNQLYGFQQKLLAERKLVTAEAVKNLYQGKEEKEHSLINLVHYHNDTMKEVLEWGTLKNYFTTQKYIEEFLKVKMKTSDIYLSQLGYKFLTEFQIFLKNHIPLDHHKPCGNNTVMKHIERLKKMVNLAIKNEWLEKDPFMKFQFKYEPNDREYLTLDELQRIENKEIKIDRLSQVRDFFVFSCYTGLAYSDVKKLSPSHIQRGIDGQQWIFISREKTKVPVNIPLLPRAIEIIEKYKDNPRSVHKGVVLPISSNQRLNSYLKELADICGITKNLTFHIARHTCATTVLLSNQIPIESVSAFLGHTSIRTTQIYAKVTRQKLSSDISNLKDKLHNNTNSKQNIKFG